MAGSRRKRKAVVVQSECVACGCCVKVCPKNAIEVIGGVYALIDSALCVGCAKCQRTCPASVIEMREAK